MIRRQGRSREGVGVELALQHDGSHPGDVRPLEVDGLGHRGVGDVGLRLIDAGDLLASSGSIVSMLTPGLKRSKAMIFTEELRIG